MSLFPRRASRTFAALARAISEQREDKCACERGERALAARKDEKIAFEDEIVDSDGGDAM